MPNIWKIRQDLRDIPILLNAHINSLILLLQRISVGLVAQLRGDDHHVAEAKRLFLDPMAWKMVVQDWS